MTMLDRNVLESELRLTASRLRELGRGSLDENDWSDAYCKASGAPLQKRSNLPFNDYLHNGVGIEWKFLKRKSPVADIGKRLMHPSASRCIELDASWSADKAKNEVLNRWADSINEFKTRATKEIKWGVVLWSPDFSEFVYFDEALDTPDPTMYTGQWIVGKHRGRPTRNLGIFDSAGNKAYSVTLPKHGSKIQPYFTVPKDAEVFSFDWFYRSIWVTDAQYEKIMERQSD